LPPGAWWRWCIGVGEADWPLLLLLLLLLLLPWCPW
jgi:hypothetical protein